MMSNREFAKHIYEYVIQSQERMLSDSNNYRIESETISYIGHLMDLHYEPENHLGSKGFYSISKDKDIRQGFGC
jgi:hypothetical protein